MPPLNKIKFVVPKELARFVGREVTREAKLAAARGALPLQPKDLIVVMFYLAHDPDPEIKAAAEKSMMELPAAILKSILDSAETHPLIIDFYARKLEPESGLLENIALNRVSHDETVCFLASRPIKRVVEIISNNQTRILRYPAIIEVLGNNPMVGQATIDRILHFIHLETGLKPREDAVQPQPQEEPQPPQGVEGQEEPQETQEEQYQQEMPAEQGEVTPMEERPDYMQDQHYPWLDEEEEAIDHWAIDDLPSELTEDYDRELEEHEKDTLTQRITKMSISDRIKMAMLGNKESRSILVKDPNKLVSGAVLQSPKLTDNEIDNISRSRTVSDDVIRQICNNNEWTRNYVVKANLVNNTKTPLPVAMRFLNFLTPRDVQSVSRSKNVAAPVATAAKKLMQKRMERKG